MGIIGEFIDQLCESHPPLARAVLDKPLAPLVEWIDFDADGQPCGCLIGTSALAAGFRPVFERTWNAEGFDAVAFLAQQINVDIGTLDRIGRHVHNISERLAGRWRAHRQLRRCFCTPASDARTVRLLRTRIARQLAIRESVGEQVARLPNEPVEAGCHVSA